MLLKSNVELIEISEEHLFLLGPLVEESKMEGFGLVARTVHEWRSGQNTFSGDGEKLWGLHTRLGFAGIGGINRDPYAENNYTGRVRHLYIRQNERRNGYGTWLMKTIMDHAKLHFTKLRLFTDQPGAAAFYEQLGFIKEEGFKSTHLFIF